MGEKGVIGTTRDEGLKVAVDELVAAAGRRNIEVTWNDRGPYEAEVLIHTRGQTFKTPYYSFSTRAELLAFFKGVEETFILEKARRR